MTDGAHTAFMADLIAARLGGNDFARSGGTYKFEAIKRAKAAARAAHPDIPLIDMGVGEGDREADSLVVESLAREAGLRENRRYADNGIPEFSRSAARYLDRVFGVVGIDPETEILHGIGSKPILAMLPAAFINPGDVLLMPTPSYPVMASWTRYLGGEVYCLPLRAENGFLPDLDAVPSAVLSRAKMLYLNYPNNPTGASATGEFFARVVDFARRNRILVVHDAAYAALSYDGAKPLSFLSVPGARDVGLEVHSLSKAFSMTGWRMGFVCGNELAVAAYGVVKANSDAGQFRAIQKAAAAALDHPEIACRTAEKYSRRFDLLVRALRDLGFDAAKPAGSFYCYVRAPSGFAGGSAAGIRCATAADAADALLAHALVSTVPWDDAGAYLRFSVTFEADGPDAERAVVEEMARRIGELKPVFG